MHSFFTYVGYLDPGTGSIIIQAIVGAAAGIAIFGRKMIRTIPQKLRSLFSRGGNKEDQKDKE